MFPFDIMGCCGSKQSSRKAHQERKLEFLKMIRDGLETQLASVNASIETVEGHIQRDTVSSEEPA